MLRPIAAVIADLLEDIGMPELAKEPPAVRRLPRDDGGEPIPWHQANVAHRGVDALNRAIAGRHCWICGGRLAWRVAFRLSPIGALQRIALEPPMHEACALWATRHEAAGLVAVWVTERVESLGLRFDPETGRDGILAAVGEPFDVTWWCDGEPAARGLVEAALDGELPVLKRGLARRANRVVVSDTMARLRRWLPEDTRREGATAA